MTGATERGGEGAAPPRSGHASVEVGRYRYLLRRVAVVLAVAGLIAATAGAANGLPFSTRQLAYSGGNGEEATTASAATGPDAEADAQADAAADAAAATGPSGGGGATADDRSTTTSLDTSAPPEPDDQAVPVVDASRLVLQAPRRVVDTDDGSEAPLADSLATFTVNEHPVAVLLSVTVIESGRDGSVLVDGRAGAVEAIRVPRAGVTTTNLVVVRLDGDEVTVRSSAGGHLTVDVVGGFEPVDGPSADGRLVPVEPQPVGELVTATDGRDLEVSLGALVPPAASGLTAAGVSGALALVTADIGAHGGTVQVGPAAGEYDQVLQWSPPVDDNLQRRGLVVLRPSGGGLASIHYDGGSRLSVEIIGYVTSSRAPVDTAGLFVQTGPRILHDGPLSAEAPVQVGGFGADASWALVTVGPTVGVPGQLGSTLLPVEGGSASLTAPGEVDAVVTLLAEIL